MKAIHNQIFIGLGSNLGDSVQNLAQAVQHLQATFQTPVLSSSVYYSEPVEIAEQPWFYNQVVAIEANNEMTPTKVLKKVKEIEATMGRITSYRYGPRLIDLDLLFFKNWVFENQFLIVPHLKVEERAFVLAPMIELAPDFINPRTNHHLRLVLENTHLSQCQKLENSSFETPGKGHQAIGNSISK